MKRLIFLFVFGIMSLVSFGQVDTLYLSKYNGSISYHSTLECPKIHKIIDTLLVSELTGMYQLNKHFRCYDCVPKEMVTSIKETITKNEYNKTFNALGIRTYESEQPSQTNKVSRDYILKVQANEMHNAGLYLQRSANLQYAAAIMSALGGVTMTVPSMKRDISEGGRKACFISGGTLIFAGLITELCAINYKFKAGSSLKISANHIQYNF